jgi:hypothetical protein
MPVYWHMRSTEPQLSGRRLKHVDGLYGIGAICVRLDGRKRAKARKRRTVGEARTHTHMREVLRLKLYRRSCVNVKSMLIVNRIRGSIVRRRDLRENTPRHPIAKRSNEATTGQNQELELSRGECAARLRKNRCRINMGVRRRRTKPKSNPRIDEKRRVMWKGEREIV